MPKLIINPLETLVNDDDVTGLQEIVETVVNQELYLGINKMDVGGDVVYNVNLREAPTNEEKWCFACIGDQDGPFGWTLLDQANFAKLDDAITCFRDSMYSLL